MKRLCLIAGSAMMIISWGLGQEQAPRNIILMIGDGMGLGQVTAGWTAKGSLELEKFHHLGLLLTQAYGEDYVTDSGAAATALATGVTTFNRAIAVGPDSSRLETVLERSQKLGKQTGIVTVCSITHATPASFVAHVVSRAMELEIASQIADSRTDIYLGSGWGWFLPKELGGRRTDGRNLLTAMSQAGYAVVTTDSAFQSLKDLPPPKTLGLFAENHVGPAQIRQPGLLEMTQYALKSLSADPHGFFLMVEGSQIDWASHDRQSDQVIAEMVDFDDTIGEVLRYAEKNPGTLVLVTADHETGGYALVEGSVSDHTVQGEFSTDHHTAVMVPLFAEGPGAERFTGIRPNRDVGKILMDLLH